ncbi:hypothetical protein [Microbulbifer sp. 2201CG32-9]|uniref:hypothetical protein n=1 Tax=unclassified Microbulbifer TaxID=2619833 RepID=UPI00345C5255
MTDIYKAPESDLTTGEESDSFGSLEKGLAGDYSIEIGAVFGEAWQRTKGHKGRILLAVLLYIVALVAVSFVAGAITGYSAFNPETAGDGPVSGLVGGALLYNLLVTVVTAPLTAGFMMIGVKVARGESAAPTEVFAHFDKLLPLAVVSILMTILVTLGMLLLVLPGIYLAVSYLLTLPLIVEKGLGPWQALETSRKAVTKHWFAFLGYIIVSILLYIAGALPLLLGLIWVLPMLAIAYGVVYRNVFGGPEQQA